MLSRAARKWNVSGSSLYELCEWKILERRPRGEIRRLPELLVRLGVLCESLGFCCFDFLVVWSGDGGYWEGVCFVCCFFPVVVPGVWDRCLFDHLVKMSSVVVIEIAEVGRVAVLGRVA